MYSMGDRLKLIRESLDLKQKDVAIKLQINNKTLSNYENDISSPDPSTISLLCRFYKVTSDYLLGLSNTNIYTEDLDSQLSILLENKDTYNNNKFSSLSSDEIKVLMYYNRLNEENKDSIKGTMVKLFREEISDK